jgi:predicted AAA+ superfamily ATPase
MPLKRKAYNEMLAWKNYGDGAGVLALDGGCCVGKTFLCDAFAKNEYKSAIIVGCRDIDREVASLFESVRAGGVAVANSGADLDAVFDRLSAIYRTRLYRWESLVVFDDVQHFPFEHQLLWGLVADRRYDYIVSGASLLGFDEHIDLFPLDFEEFLWAIGDDNTSAFVRRCFERRKPLGAALHRRVMNDFLLYALVGGMPSAVLAYLEGKDFAAAEREKSQILDVYRCEIACTGGIGDASVASVDGGNATVLGSDRALAVFDAIPWQLLNGGRKFKPASVEKGLRLSDCEGVFRLLGHAKMINECRNTDDPEAGMPPCVRGAVRKVYMADTGLLATRTFGGEFRHAALLGNLGAGDKRGAGDGMLLENAVAQALRCNGHRLCFYSRAGAGNAQNKMDIDFLIERDGKTCPVSVKTTVNRAGSSLDKYRKKFASEIGDAFVLYPGDVMVKNGVVHLPFYMAMCL